MKILLFSDVHWSKTSSIVKGLSVNYTQRLEYLIKSMNWVNELCEQENCDFMICAGDMMDKSSCNDMELTALKDIQWNNKDCYFLCGNHESSVMDLRYSSLKVLESKNHYIINKSIFQYNQNYRHPLKNNNLRNVLKYNMFQDTLFDKFQNHLH